MRGVPELARLDARAHPLVLGTIDAANVPSLRTARRVGRTDAGGWVFVPDPRRKGAAWPDPRGLVPTDPPPSRTLGRSTPSTIDGKLAREAP